MTEIDYRTISIEDLASLVAGKLKEHRINVVLVGGACVTIYSHNQYQSYDLDFVSYDDIKKIQNALSELGFVYKGKYFIRSGCPFFVEFVSPPVAIGREQITVFDQHVTLFGEVKLLTPTDCVKDRLASYYHWGDRQALEQAILVSLDQMIDLEDIKNWSAKEHYLDKFEEYKKALELKAQRGRS